MNEAFQHSQIYQGHVRHRRFSPKPHHFSYSLFMLALDVQEVEQKKRPKGLFGYAWYHPLRFVEKDYLRGEPNALSQRIKDKVTQLGGSNELSRITMLVQVRCFGLYFSPANFYFCYNKAGQCTQMLAEVSNTPWNKRHYYLVNLQGDKVSDKTFHVSPFMDLNMAYHWQIKAPTDDNSALLVHIENRRNQNADAEKLFDATLAMKKQAFNRRNIFKTWCTIPAMTMKIIAGIYWQALKLFAKRIPFVPYQKAH